MRLKNQSILRKIAVPALILAGVSILISAYATISVERLVETVSIQDKVASRLKYALTAQSAFNSAAVSEKNVILTGTDTATAAAHITKYEDAVNATLKSLDQLLPLADLGEQHDLADTMRVNVLRRKEVSQKVFQLSAEGQIADAFALSSKEAAKFRKTAADAVDQLIQLNSDDLDQLRGRADDDAMWMRILLGSARPSDCCSPLPRPDGSRRRRSPSRFGGSLSRWGVWPAAIFPGMSTMPSASTRSAPWRARCRCSRAVSWSVAAWRRRSAMSISARRCASNR